MLVEPLVLLPLLTSAMSTRSATTASSDGRTSRQGSSKHKRVVTTPSWARQLPPDDFDDEGEEYIFASQTSAVPPRRASNPLRRSLSSIVRDPAKAKQPASGIPTPPTSATPLRADNEHDGGQLDEPPENGTTPMAPVHSANDLRRATLGADRWWTFTLPSKYLDKVHDYVTGEDHHGPESPTHEKGKERESREEGDDDGRRSVKEERRRSKHERVKSLDLEKQEYHRNMSMSMGTRLAPPNVFSINQTQTPGWSSPWTPFHRDGEGPHQDPFTIAQAVAQQQQSKTTRFETFILRNPFTPLLFRSINVIVVSCALGLAAHVRLQEHRAKVIGVIGSSTLFIICVAPIAISHIFITLYIEYFGPPIGIWSIRTKMFHTLTELIFICLWSSILSLAMDDLFTSSLECTPFTPYARYNISPANVGSSAVEGTLADSICGQQVAQVVFVFLSVVTYAAILIVSLFRIFAKVSRK